MVRSPGDVEFFYFNDPATSEIYTLSLHDALPISTHRSPASTRGPSSRSGGSAGPASRDRKSTRLNSSPEWISYAVVCLKKKKMGYTEVAKYQGHWKSAALCVSPSS